jgi:glycosyltransferase involved in cell wall biosynthesis
MLIGLCYPLKSASEMSVMKIASKKLGNIVERGFYKKLHGRHGYVPKVQGQLEINLVTSWNEQCGIATYSAFLAEELQKKVKLYIASLPNKNAINPCFKILGYSVGSSHDLVHVQFEYGLFPSLKLGKKTLTSFSALSFYFGLAMGNRRVVTTIHEPRKAALAGVRSGYFYTNLLDKVIFAVSDMIIVHTRESKQLMKTVYGVEESKLRILPHGSYQKPNFKNKDECKHRLNLQNRIVVTILGFVTPKKGHDLVIPLLPNLDRNVQLVIAGGPQNAQDEQYIGKLKKLTEQNHCEDRVTFTGYLPDFTDVLNATDMALLPYRNVTDSGVLHLLTAYGVPIIASDLEAFREVYDEYGCLILFKSGDPKDLLAKTQELLGNQHQRDLLKSNCLAMWNATKWSNIAQKHVQLYREVLSKTG